MLQERVRFEYLLISNIWNSRISLSLNQFQQGSSTLNTTPFFIKVLTEDSNTSRLCSSIFKSIVFFLSNGLDTNLLRDLVASGQNDRPPSLRVSRRSPRTKDGFVRATRTPYAGIDCFIGAVKETSRPTLYLKTKRRAFYAAGFAATFTSSLTICRKT